MARFQFGQQPETGCGPWALNSLVDQNPWGFVHGFTLEGQKLTDYSAISWQPGGHMIQSLKWGEFANEH